MKNMFGVVPGAKYGWPKTFFIGKELGKYPRRLRHGAVHFVIADAIVAMEGNGPLNGHPRPLNRIVLADDPVAADATCARLMGLDPTRITHIRIGAQFLGNASVERIDQVAEAVCAPANPFEVVLEFQHLRVTGSAQRDP